MSKVRFEEDELNIIAMFEEETREDTITFIQEAASFLEEDDEGWTIEAEVFGKGIDMWLRSQGKYVQLIGEPDHNANL